ncbi:MAG TPA: SCO family protein [Blastocatellia bacterium]|nr:SCO family protein [Blastocatellia bacterium]
MRKGLSMIALSVAALFVFCWAQECRAQSNGPAPNKEDKATSAEASPAEKYFTDVVLINQDGRPMRLYTDLLKGKVVVINTFFTTCVSVCPPMSRNLEKVQEWLGSRLGKDAHIISITVDIDTDTPPRLKEYAEKYKARQGWYFLGGKKENVEFALRKLGQFVEAKDDHTTIMIVGNLQTGLWKKAFGLAKPDDLIKVVESVLNDKGETAK